VGELYVLYRAFTVM